MGNVELWLGAAGSGKTSAALAVLRERLADDWSTVRYIVPTVGHKLKVEELLLQPPKGQTLCGDPVNIFFTFAQEVAQRGGIHGKPVSELQKYLLLKRLIQQTSLEHFARAARFPGFVQALGEIIDELKVHMITPEQLLQSAEEALEQGAATMALKLKELGGLYQAYQQYLITNHLFDNEGIMWLAAECLREQPDLLKELKCLILDGFARLTPIQLHFLQALAPRIERVIVLFDYEEGRTIPYHPVKASLDRLNRMEENGEVSLRIRHFSRAPRSPSALTRLRQELFRDRRQLPLDNSVRLISAATPAHEVEMIARDIHSLLHEGHLPDGTPVNAGDIAILVRNADQLRDRFARVFAHYGLSIRQAPLSLAHTGIGRTLFALFRLLRDGWKREDLLTLLRSGFLPCLPSMAFRVDLIARTQALREGRSAWGERWPDEDTRAQLDCALAPIYALDAAYHGDGTQPLLVAIAEFVDRVRIQALGSLAAEHTLPWPDVEAATAESYVAMTASFAQITRMLEDLRSLDALLGGFQHAEVLDIFSTALQREQVREPSSQSQGIPLLSVHSTAGEKYGVVYLCNLLQGAFPRRQRESAFLMDHEREESLRKVHVFIDSRKHLEDDEQFWFLHALSASTHSVVLSYAQHDMAGSPLERSIFLDDVFKVLPELPAAARSSSFREVAPPYAEAAHSDEYLARLLCDLRAERGIDAQSHIAAAHLACAAAHGIDAPLARALRMGSRQQAQLADEAVFAAIATRRPLFSASEFQSFADCPFLWYARSCLGIDAVPEEFSALDRGSLLHAVLEAFYRKQQTRPGMPVHLEQWSFDELWERMNGILLRKLDAEPRYRNRAQILRDIELHSLQRLLQRFLRMEMARAQQRKLHPLAFEQPFGDSATGALRLADGEVEVRGVLDRMDVDDAQSRQAVVVDYKSALSMTLKGLAEGKVLQAPIYALALQRLLGYDALGVEFIDLKRAEVKGLYHESYRGLCSERRGVKSLSATEWGEWLATSETQLCDLALRMRSGEIALTPTTKRCPDRCEYFPLCRGTRFSLLRAARGATAGE